MKQRTLGQLGKRERQIAELLYSMKTGSVDVVIKAIENPPSYSAVRTTLNILVRKRFLQAVQERPKVPLLAHGKHRKRRAGTRSAAWSRRISTTRSNRPSAD